MGKRAAEAEGVLPRPIDVKVDLSDDGVIAAMDGRVEAVATEVESPIFTIRRAVAARILLKHRKDA